MLLSELLKDVKVKCKFTDVQIKDVTDNSQKAENGFAFVCIKGENSDGHEFANDLSEKGVVCITQKDLGLKNQVLVENTREAYSLICANYFLNPARKLKLIAVTGTNGKTTTTYLIKELLERAGKKVGLIGTIEDVVGEVSIKAKRTTPDPYFLQSLFKRMVESDCEYCVMEVSSQALSQGRVHGCFFEHAVFTNLSQDHLDYHKTMSEYLNAKKILFYNAKNAIVNVGDEYSSLIIENIPAKIISFAINHKSDYLAKNVAVFEKSSVFEIEHNKEILNIKIPIPGEFSVLNALGALVVANLEGIDIIDIKKFLETTKPVRGRMEYIPIDKDYTVIVDYAHTPDGLENVINVLNKLKKGKIITVFGCGGNRDKSKRKLMGDVVSRLSDFSVITSDNPRNEDPMSIIYDIMVAFEKTPKEKFAVVADRKKAIEYALSIAKKDDIVLLAGKGHECYQINNDGIIHFDEREIVKTIISNIK